MLRKFIECLFISVDIQVKENQIYPDILFDGKIAYPRQIERFKECEKMMIAIDLAGWLSDPQIILQAVVQCYGLVAPLIFYNIPYEPITQVFNDFLKFHLNNLILIFIDFNSMLTCFGRDTNWSISTKTKTNIREFTTHECLYNILFN